MMKKWKTTDDCRMFLGDVANAVCQHIPEGWEIQLCMENGAAPLTPRPVE